MSRARTQNEDSGNPDPLNCCLHCYGEHKGTLMFQDRMIVCSECGNKRCPKATYHGYECTCSNDPGQRNTMNQLRIRLTGPVPVPVPTYATPGAAGFDLCAAISAPVWLQPGEHRFIPTGIAVEIPFGYEGQVRARSGLAAKHGLGLVNGVGTIDCDYRGIVGLLLVNHGDAPVKIEPLMRCGQLVIAPVVQVAIQVVEELAETERGGGGFGSTGS